MSNQKPHVLVAHLHGGRPVHPSHCAALNVSVQPSKEPSSPNGRSSPMCSVSDLKSNKTYKDALMFKVSKTRILSLMAYCSQRGKITPLDF